MLARLGGSIGVVAALLASCTASRGQIDGAPRDVAAYDSVLFLATLLHLSAGSRDPLRVDPRPLPPDPNVVSLHPPERVVPEFARGQTANDETLDRISVPHRTRILEETSTPSTDAWKDRLCPGVLVPPIPGAEDRKPRDCPKERFRSAVVAVHRAGGVHWPNNVDERESHGPNAVTVRGIVHDLSPDGFIEESFDYVYRCIGRTGCTLVEVKPLLIVE